MMLRYLIKAAAKPLESVKSRFVPHLAATGGRRVWGSEYMRNGRRVPAIYKDKGPIERRYVSIKGAVEKEVPLSNYYYGYGFLSPMFWHAIDKVQLQEQDITCVYWKKSPPGILKIETDASLRRQRGLKIVVEGFVVRAIIKGKVICDGYYRVLNDNGLPVLYHECQIILVALRESKDYFTIPGSGDKFESEFDGVHVSTDCDNAVILITAELKWTHELDLARNRVLGDLKSDVERILVKGIVSQIAEELVNWGRSGKTYAISSEYREGQSLVDYCTRKYSAKNGLQKVTPDSSFRYINGRDVDQSEPYLRLPPSLLAYLKSLGNLPGNQND